MPKMEYHAGRTGVVERIFFNNTSLTVEQGLTGVAYNTTGLTFSYSRKGDTSVTSGTPVAGSLGSHVDWGFVEVDALKMPGVYEVGVPDAALAAGADSVVLYVFGCVNMPPYKWEVQLTANDPVAGSVVSVVNAVTSNLTLAAIAAKLLANPNTPLANNAGSGALAPDLTLLLGTPRAVSTSIADAAITLQDALWAAVVEAYGQQTAPPTGTTFTKETPAGTTARAFITSPNNAGAASRT